MSVPASLVAAARLTGVRALDWKRPVWFAESNGTPVVVQEMHPAWASGDVDWIHRLLDGLSRRGFPAPRPVRCFDGSAVGEADGRRFTVVTRLDGITLDRLGHPEPGPLGRFVARYHATAVDVAVEGPGPDPPRLDSLAAWAKSVPRSDVEWCLGGGRLAERFRRHLEAVLEGAAALSTWPVLPLHGDLTAVNVVASGDPPGITGLIDFAMAHLGPRAFELAGCLWYAGRPQPHWLEYDPERIVELCAGYTSVTALSEDELLAIPTLLRARGVQLLLRFAARRDLTPRPETILLRMEAMASIQAALSERLRALAG